MKTSRINRVLGIVLGGALLVGGLAACSEIAPPDQVGLYYMEGPIDGYKFDHCFKPGSTTNAKWNNSTVLLPNSLRNWKISEDSTDSKTPIQVPSAPEAQQPSGVMMNVWTQTNFMLNTNCGTNDKDGNSPIVQFWEKIGRRYEADQTEGWKNMLNNTIVTALTTVTGSIIRQYPADVLVAGTKKDEIQQKISDAFTPELKRLVGGDFFCGPTFDRNKTDCPPVQVLLLPVDYANKAIQTARDEKQAAIERASALVAEAQGKVDAANKIGQLYNNPNWVELQKAQNELAEVQACAANPNCTIVIGGNGAIITSTK